MFSNKIYYSEITPTQLNTTTPPDGIFRFLELDSYFRGGCLHDGSSASTDCTMPPNIFYLCLSSPLEDAL